MKFRDMANLKTEMLEPLYYVEQEISDMENNGKVHLIEYTTMDIIAVSHIFIHILANKKAHLYHRSGQDKDMAKVEFEMTEFGSRINDLIYDMTDIKIRKGKQDGK